MNTTQRDTAEIKDLLFPLIGEVTAKRLFIGYGLFHQKDMFALYQTGIIYLRVKNELAKELEQYGAVSWTIYHQQKNLNAHHYYRLPKSVTDNFELYRKFLEKSLDQIRKEKLDLKLMQLNRIRDMPNLSIKYERLLAKVDILNVQQLRIVGASNCYVRLAKNGFVSGLDVFWKLSAALKDRRAESFSDKEKEELLKVLNSALLNAGLRAQKFS